MGNICSKKKSKNLTPINRRNPGNSFEHDGHTRGHQNDLQMPLNIYAAGTDGFQNHPQEFAGAIYNEHIGQVPHVVAQPNVVHTQHVGQASADVVADRDPANFYRTGDVVVGLFDFEPRSASELEFRKKDLLYLIAVEDQDWLQAESRVTGHQGYIPASYVALQHSLHSYEWYFGSITRREAQTLLNGSEIGTFLVREAFSKPGNFALSVTHRNSAGQFIVKQYLINRHSDNTYSIWNKCHFDRVVDLIDAYQAGNNDLPCQLIKPYEKPPPPLTELSVETKSEWEIDRSQITLLHEIGSGNFGKVYYGKWNKITDVAVKTLKKGSMPDSQFLEEATIMKGLTHENIVKLLATCSKEEPIYIITQFMKRGSLHDLLKRCGNDDSLSPDQMMEFAFQIAKGMHYLEEKNLIHRDLAARNVLVDESYICKISDFGLAKIIANPDEPAVTSGKIPVKWSPPEVYLRGAFSSKSDMWSFGIVVIEIYTYGKPLYKGMSVAQVKQEVYDGYRLPQPPLCPVALYEVLLLCWDFNPANRPTFKQLRDYLDEQSHKTVDGTQYAMM